MCMGMEASDKMFYANAVPCSALCATMLLIHVHIKDI